MTRYTPPTLTDHKVLYKGKRFWVFEANSDHPFEWVEDGLVIWDKADGAILALAKRLDDGKYEGSLAFSNVEITFKANTLEELVKISDREAISYLKAVF